MSHPSGMLTREQLAELVSKGEIDTVLVVFTDLYGRFMGKRFDAGFFLENTAEHGSGACNYLVTVDMEMDPVAGYRFANWERGYGDFHLVPDLATLRLASWLDRTALVQCDVQDVSTHELVRLAPRSLLREQVERARRAGYTAKAGSELEYYIFRGSYRDAARNGYRDLEPLGWYIEDYHVLQGTREEDFNGALRRHLARSGVPVESTKGEWGRGQHELNVQYAEVLEMADRHTVLKQCAKEVAERMQLSVTFMAKFAEGQAGSSSHVHLSLWRGDQNEFAGEGRFGPVWCSDVFRWFLGGWISHAPEFMVFYAPTVNSYKRFQAGSWAPTALAWSYDNRTAGFRVVGHGPSLRIECRVPGADCNPYLTYAAALASGLDGIARRTEPPPEFSGNVYTARELARLPHTLHDARDLFGASEFVKQTLGEDVVEHYAHFFQTEQDAYNKAVTDWERRRYFERI